MLTGAKAARSEFNATLDRLQTELMTTWVDKSLPDDWTGLDTWHPIEPHKTRVTVRLDADMVRWFRKLGPGYGARMNMVLRVYWKALQAGLVQGHHDDNTIPRIRTQAIWAADERVNGRVNGRGE